MRWLAVSLLATAVACGGGGDDDDDDDDVTVDAGDADARVAALDGPCPLDDRVGSFAIRHEVDDGFSVAEGFVADKVEPATVLQLEYEEGGCQFLRKINPFCDPPCTAGQTCDLSDACVAAPERLNAGVVTVTGLAAALELQPNDITKDYQDFSIPHPPFSAGATIVLSAAGDEVGAFQLDGRGVEPLEIASNVWTMVEGEDFAIEWTASDGPGEIYVTLNIDLHGNSPVTMHCTFEDTGSAIIPANMVQRLVDFGVTVGFASAQIYRRTVDRVDVAPGCVDFSVHSHINPQFALQQ